MKEATRFLLVLIGAVILIVLIFFGARLVIKTPTVNSSELDALAKCLTANDAVMYGAYWCPHCQNEKATFGQSFEFIDYTECDPNGPNANPDACQAAGVQGYPTWKINGTLHPGEQTLSNLKQLSGC